MGQIRKRNNRSFRVLWVVSFIYSLRIGYVICASQYGVYDYGSVTIAMKDHVCTGDDVTSYTKTGSAIVCAMECLASDACLGFFYDNLERTCVKCKRWWYGDVTDLGDCTGMVYFRQNKVPGPWSTWSPCSKTCGGGVKTRTMTCDACGGSPSDAVLCHDFSCTPIGTSCAEWASRGLAESILNAYIDPDGPGTEFEPVVVPCDLHSEPGKAITVLHHSAESRTRVNGYERCGSYSVSLVYDVTFQAAVRIADDSTACRQYVKYECLRATLSRPRFKSTCTASVNRHNAKSPYFTGPYSSGSYCECGHLGTCTKQCECDYERGELRYDDGNITDKDDLPIFSFRAGDTGGSNEEGYHTIGPLYCW